MDPLPHPLEAVYDYLLKLARVRFLLADDARAGKTIMSGLLIRELKLRGLAERILEAITLSGNAEQVRQEIVDVRELAEHCGCPFERAGGALGAEGLTQLLDLWRGCP